jgi:hypothetical protein
MEEKELPPTPFTTDGCSGLMSFFWRTVLHKPPPWESCCVDHDRAYWIGGAKRLRLEADAKLMRGVIDNGHPYWAVIMFIAVRIGGGLPLPSVRRVEERWRVFFGGVRWGYGWPRSRKTAKVD